MINTDELLFVVDENNNPVEPKPRSHVHANGLWHRTAQIFVVDESGRVLCQQRSLKKDSYPGKWEPFFGGHLGPNVPYANGAITELGEELGLNIEPSKLQNYKIYKYDKNHEFCGIFYTYWNGDIANLKIEKDEVEQVLWIAIEDVLTHYEPVEDPRWVHIGYETDFLKKLIIKQ